MNTTPTHGEYYRVRDTYIPKLLTPTNQLLYNIQVRLTFAGQPYPLPPSANTCDLLYSNEPYSTYGTQHPLLTSNSFARTSVQRASTALTLFPLSTTLLLWSNALAQATRFLQEDQWRFYLFSTRNAIHCRMENMCTCLPFRLATPPGFDVTRIPKGERCHISQRIYVQTLKKPCTCVRAIGSQLYGVVAEENR